MRRGLYKVKRIHVQTALMSKPVEGKVLYLYLAVSDCATSVALIREDLGEQKLVYYVSKVLLEPKTRYQKMEKLSLVLVTIARKLQLYFESFIVVYMTEYPLRSILHSLDASSKVTELVIELGQYKIIYQPRTSIKA